MPKRSPKTKQALTTLEPIEPVIRIIRGLRVILDSDLAKIPTWTEPAEDRILRIEVALCDLNSIAHQSRARNPPHLKIHPRLHCRLIG